MNKKVWIYTVLSGALTKREGLEEYNKKVNELKEISADIAPEGNLIIALFDTKTKYRYFEKAMMNLSLIPKIFNERNFFSDPESAIKLKEIKFHLEAINKIIEKEKKKTKRRNNAKN